MLFSYQKYFNAQKRRFFMLFGDDRKAIAGKFLQEETDKLKELQVLGHITPQQVKESIAAINRMMARFIASGDTEKE